MPKKRGFCFYYCLLISIFASLFLTYIALLCVADSLQLDVEDKTEHSSTVFIAAGFYEFIAVLMLIQGFLCTKRQGPVQNEGYQKLENKE
ncbi:unnamed protein product [Blepharisma stoltei]|uniref:Uncharacterized protein n=1 Tax=Blepharisma stoltei TaxID=1481888 RepID=A0AAU9JLN4_9CILI|nr:unnamed protein product [Blepharisma stoltei]|mmetsp:Transcript_23636/g.23387  ORF Transcript_23636/g.23387 Transcript_23636/m.23387 type:complete len:90 (+) Transcript_23636:28-297(+)